MYTSATQQQNTSKDRTINKSQKYVFVYGTLKRGFPLNNHMAVNDSRFIGPATVVNNIFIMRDLGAFPALQLTDAGEGDIIYGELWTASEGLIRHLDQVESYPTFYDRDEIEVVVGDKEYLAYTYFIDPKVENEVRDNSYILMCDVIPSGHWGSEIVPNENDMTPYTSDTPTEDIILPDLLDDEEYHYESRFVDAEYDDDDDDYDDDVSYHSDDPTPSFTVDANIYVTTEWGHSYGPFNDLTEAIDSLQSNAELANNGDVNCMTIGFRMIRDDLSEAQLQTIQNFTIPS